MAGLILRVGAPAEAFLIYRVYQRTEKCSFGKPQLDCPFCMSLCSDPEVSACTALVPLEESP